MTRKLTFKCAVTSGLTPFLNLQNTPVALKQNGNNWTGSSAVDVDDTLSIAVTVSGVNGSPWSVDITIDCPGGSPAKIFSRTGTIPKGGSQGFTASAKVPAQPCTGPMTMALAVVKARPASKKSATKKKAAAKKKRTTKKAAQPKPKSRRP